MLGLRSNLLLKGCNLGSELGLRSMSHSNLCLGFIDFGAEVSDPGLAVDEAVLSSGEKRSQCSNGNIAVPEFIDEVSQVCLDIAGNSGVLVEMASHLGQRGEIELVEGVHYSSGSSV